MSRRKIWLRRVPISTASRFQLCLVEWNSASLGLEPRQRDPESLVLPLHHEATSEKTRTDLPHCKLSAVALARDLSGCGFCAEQDVSAFSSRLHFQRLPAFCDQCASAFHHFIDHFVVMIRIVME